jgi:putative transposase
VSDTFEFIDAEYARSISQNLTEAPPIAKMCVWSEVSRSGYYEWRSRPESATGRRRDELKQLIRHFFDESDGTYGYRRVHADLTDGGVACGPELVWALMRELGLEPCQPKPWRYNLTAAGDQPHAVPDLLGRDFTAVTPGQKMVGDITYIPTWQGWLSWPPSSTATRVKSSGGR